MKKYKLIITSRQADRIIQALDLYTRLSVGQVSELNNITDKDKSGFHIRVSHGTLSLLQREMFPSLSGINSSYGIHSQKIPDEIRESYDIFKVMMYEFNKGKGIMNVYAVVNPETGEKKFAWKFGGEFNIYTIVGVLKSIIHNLLTQLQENTFQGKP